MITENDLFNLLEKETSIIVYGAGYRAHIIIARIQGCDLDQKIRVAVTDTATAISYCCNKKVHNLSELKCLAGSSVVLIATHPKYYKEMILHAQSLGFERIIPVNNTVFLDMKKRLHQDPNKQLFIQYQTINQIRLNHLREKVRAGSKLKVIFVLTSKAKFNYASVYRAMENNPLFEVVLYILDENLKQDLEGMREYSRELERQGYNVIWGYDESNYLVPIENYSPDIIFYNACYLPYLSQERRCLRKAVLNHLSCYMSYGFLISTRDRYHFENEEILPAWLYFLANRQEYALSANYISGTHAVLSGHPLFDAYVQDTGFTLPEKLKGKKKLIIYAPHWSIDTWVNTSTFHIIGEYILSLLQKYPDIGFVFKPHPTLVFRIRRRESNPNIPTYEQWQNYCQTWKNSPNGIIVTDSSYIQWFKKSDCLITDSYSFILSWLPTEKPCIYLLSPNGPADIFESYQHYLKPVLESYYLCDSEESLKRLIEKVVINNEDDKADERKRQKAEVIYNFGHAGEFIVNYIEKQLRD